MVNQNIDPQTRSKVKAEIKDFLIFNAERKTTVTYKELCGNIKQTNMNPDDALLNDLLGEISKESTEKHKVLLSALVVKKSTSLPGNGFFSMAKELGYKITERKQFVKSQIDLIHNQYRNKDLLTL